MLKRNETNMQTIDRKSKQNILANSRVSNSENPSPSRVQYLQYNNKTRIYENDFLYIKKKR